MHLAAFDILFFLDQGFEAGFGALSEAEIVGLAFFACVISLSEGRPISDWGYEFVRTRERGIVSSLLSEALKSLVDASYIESDASGYAFILTKSGSRAREKMMTQAIFRERLRFLDAAALVLSLSSPGLLKNAIDQEPSVRSSVNADRPDILLGGPARNVLHSQLRAIVDILKSSDGTSDKIAADIIGSTYYDYLSRASREAFMQSFQVSSS
jgi:hypothetical protein